MVCHVTLRSLVARVMTMMGVIDGCIGVLGDVLPQLGEGVSYGMESVCLCTRCL